MSSAIQHRRGTTAQHSTFTGLVGEVTVDTTLDTIVVHDGATAGGHPLAKASDIGPGEIHASDEKSPPVNADEIGLVDSEAAWVRKKITFANLKLFLFGSPALTGTPTAPTQSPGNDTTRLATTAFVQAATAIVVGGASAGMDTLGEIETAVALKAPIANPTFTGTPAAPTAAPGTDTTQVATTGFVKAAIDVILGGVTAAGDTLAELYALILLRAPLASPTLTGVPAAPTATVGTNTTQLATTAFANAASAAAVVATVVRQQVFTGTGTYTPHANMLSAVLEGVGGGGGGGGAASTAASSANGGGGGGGGEYSRVVVTKADIGASKAVTIGAAGAAATAGNNAGGAGGTTSVGTLLTAVGGSPGGGAATSTLGTAGAGGAGGTGSAQVGAPGRSGLTTPAYTSVILGPLYGGNGGDSAWGRGGAASVSAAGSAGTGFGGGGGGGSDFSAGGNKAGGVGTIGKVIITEFCSA